MGQLGPGVQIVPPSVPIADPTDAEDAGAGVARLGHAPQLHAPFDQRYPADLHPPVRQVQPRILIGGELVGRQHHVVARLPGKALGHQGDAFGRVADQGDLLLGRVQ